MRRDVVVEVSSRGMVKTGLKSDICQVSWLLWYILIFRWRLKGTTQSTSHWVILCILGYPNFLFLFQYSHPSLSFVPLTTNVNYICSEKQIWLVQGMVALKSVLTCERNLFSLDLLIWETRSWRTRASPTIVMTGLIINNYSRSARWIWVGFNHLISNKREWNNCFIKNTHKISRFFPTLFVKHPIFSLFLILSRRVQLPCLESMV